MARGLYLALCLVLVVASVLPAQARLGVDVSTLTSQSSFACMVNAGYNFAIIRAYRSSGTVDPNAVQSIKNAWAGGMKYVDVYMFPNPQTNNGAQQAKDLVNSLTSVKYGMIWVDVEQYNWHSNQATNQKFFADIVTQLTIMGKHFGVYTSKSQWVPIMGSSYTGGKNYDLWYAHYDGIANFNDFSAFGGWTKPAIKQYNGNKALCSCNVDMNYSP
jgi:hypothetical protein